MKRNTNGWKFWDEFMNMAPTRDNVGWNEMDNIYMDARYRSEKSL